MEGTRNNLHGTIIILLQNGLRNFLLGIFHSNLRHLPYETMMSFLLSIEVLFVSFFVAAVSLRVYRTLLSVWVGLYLTFARIILIGTLYFDYVNVGDILIETIQSSIIIGMLGVYIIATAAMVFSTIL